MVASMSTGVEPYGSIGGDDLERLHRAHYSELVRLASLLLGDRARSEEVVQDAFVRLAVRSRVLRDPSRAPAYLRSAVLNGARSALRHGKVVDRHASRHLRVVDASAADVAVLASEEHRRVIEALRALPIRQREALALKFYGELSESEIAEAMGVSAGSVKTHVHRGLAALAAHLEDER
jgi:RNA polymerase sigma-70 factor (sigma-E family)